MASLRAHAPRTAAPGVVVIVLAVAAVLFGLAVVDAPGGSDPRLAEEVRRLREEVAELSAEVSALVCRANELEHELGRTGAPLAVEPAPGR